MFCEKCGAEVPDGVKFCPKCGHELSASSLTVDSIKYTWNSWGAGKKVIAIIVACCIGLFIVSMIVGGFSHDQNTSSVTSDLDSGSNNANEDNSVTANTEKETSNKSESNSDSVDKVYHDGTYKVGSDLPAGEYKFTQTSKYGGYVERSSTSSMEIDDIISNECTSKEGSSVYVSVNNGEYLKIEGGDLVKA